MDEPFNRATISSIPLMRRRNGSKKNRKHIIVYPSQSLDTIAIENLWRESELNVQKKGAENIAQMKEICIKEWNRVSSESCRRLELNYSKRHEALINRGYEKNFNAFLWTFFKLLLTCFFYTDIAYVLMKLFKVLNILFNFKGYCIYVVKNS